MESWRAAGGSIATAPCLRRLDQTYNQTIMKPSARQGRTEAIPKDRQGSLSAQYGLPSAMVRFPSRPASGDG